MIHAVNAVLACITTGLFTAGFLVIALRLGWFPVLIVHAMTQEEFDEREREQEGDDYE